MKLSDLSPEVRARVKKSTTTRTVDQCPREYVLPYPPTVNTYWRHVVFGKSARVLISREGRAYKHRVESMFQKSPIHGPVRFTALVYRPRRIGDLDNLTKSLLDSLKGIAFVDDSQVEEIIMRRFEDKANPRVVVRVEPIL